MGDEGASGNFQYQAPTSQSMVSASIAGSIPKGDITKELWKRLHDNLPYLLKTKGTERGMKALMSCYGIPESILHVKEYGGPVTDKTTFRTFSYEKTSKMATPSAGSFALTRSAFNIRYNDPLYEPQIKTIQTRFLPTKGATTSFDLISLATTGTNPHDVIIGISQSIDTSQLGGIVTGKHLV